MKKIVLASKSPRRDEILTLIGVEHDILSPEADESSVVFDPALTPEEYVMALSKLKSDALEDLLKIINQKGSCDNDSFYLKDDFVDFQQVSSISNDYHKVILPDSASSSTQDSTPPEVTISADTIVWCEDWRGGVPMGKPKNHDEAVEMLETLSGKTHAVLTGVTLRNRTNGEILTFAEHTDVTFREVEADEIEYYLLSFPPYDKAGAYGIQEKAAVFVKEIRGEYFNVMGLPVVRLYDCLRHWGYVK